MTARPPFFEPIRQSAARRWNQLEADPELAGPWHQLFKQVQSPRHVLSELLQNADDAGAREARARMENGVFLFEHDGEDFTEAQFASLCGFGYSNKRDLHTIGFRGIGFKSLFSLGDRVEVFTPTLSLYFDRRRFTEPHWLGRNLRSDGKTCIRVEIMDDHRQHELEKNLDEWLQSPLSLLFFRHIRRLHVGKEEIHWRSLGAGPVPGSEWMVLGEAETPRFLLIRSEAVAFPQEAIAEIQQERMLAIEEEPDFPPCRIEIVLGAEGRLFVVLPTDVETNLPFACNAPFIQDPARLKIKDPETSPTNRWLLQRAGRLAAASMLSWLNESGDDDAHRARAYGLFPDVDREDSSIAGACGTLVEESFESAISGKSFLLTEDGSLVESGQCVALPAPVLEIWPAQQAAALFDDAGRAGLSCFIDAKDRQKLINWNIVEEVDRSGVLATLQRRHVPRPRTWHQLLRLWAYVAREITSYSSVFTAEHFHIVPVQGKDLLYGSSEVVRLGEKRLLACEDDWEFLAGHLLVLDHRWSRFLADQRRAAESRKDRETLERLSAAHAVLDKLGLAASTDVSQVIDRVAAGFFAKKTVSIEECVRLAQIAAKLGATAKEHFRYVTRDGHLRSVTAHVLFDDDGSVEELVPESKRESLLLHSAYVQSFTSCTRKEWRDWVTTGRAGLHTLPPLVERRIRVFGRTEIDAELRRRGVASEPYFPYVTDDFILVDWDFDEDDWRHWRELSSSDSRVWATIAKLILEGPTAYWKEGSRGTALQVATTGREKPITSEWVLPSWILRLRDVPCLRDTRGEFRKPGDLLRRTPETDCLVDVEAFVHRDLDREENRPLLELLGVQSKPTGPDRLLDCLRTLAMSEKPPIHEVERWYRRLDQMVDTCSTEDLEKITEAFRSEKLILTDQGTWATVSAVFLGADEQDVPGAALVRDSAANLALWRKLGVAERPTADLVIRWLKEFALGQKLPQTDLARVRAVLARHPERVWRECGAWINLAGEWVATDTLSYALTMQSRIPWRHLHDWVTRRTADFQRLPVQVTGAPPFSDLPSLATRIEERFLDEPWVEGEPEQPLWLMTLGVELSRIVLDSDAETERVRALARQLAGTRWVRASDLATTPYIDGRPAGMQRRLDVLWRDHDLYVVDLPKAKLAKRVPEEIAKEFNRPEIKAALDYSYDRSPEDVRAYLEENFELEAPDQDLAGDEPPTAVPAATPSQPGAGSGEACLGAVGAPAGGNDGEGLAPPAPAASGEADELADAPDATANVRRRVTRRPDKPSLIERFAMAQGYRREAEGRFCHADGSSITKAIGGRFPWERRSPAGDLIRYYWPKEHCLDRAPLEIEADVWALIEDRPDLYALILVDPNGKPIEVAGGRLRELRDQERLRIYPATYRLVLQGDARA